MPVIEHIISLIAPHRCLACSAEGSLLCKKCSSQLPPAVSRCFKCQQLSSGGLTCASCSKLSALRVVSSATAYDDVAKLLVHQLKFERALAAVGPIAKLMQARVKISPNSIVTYAPTANARVRLRGYDQAQRIARAIAADAGVPFYPLLARLTNNRQVGASAEQRQQQATHAFRLLTPHIPKHKPVIIVDDVITTGATLDAAARVLNDAGIQDVRAITFAQA